MISDVYYINLAHREDRRQHMELTLPILGIPVHRFEAIKPTKEDKEWFPDIVGSDWKELILDIVANYRDESFILQFLSPKVIRDFRLFQLSDHKQDPHYQVKAIHNDDGYKSIRKEMARQYDYNYRIPDIQVRDFDHDDKRSLLLHMYRGNSGRELARESTVDVLNYIAYIWGYEVQLDVFSRQEVFSSGHKEVKFVKYKTNKKIRVIFKDPGSDIFVVFLHGLKSDLTGKKPNYLMKQCKKRKVGFMALEYSGHGKSSGKFTDGNISKWSRESKLLIEKILIIDDPSTGSKSNIKQFSNDKRVIFINSKIEDIENIESLFSDYDFCYHLAAGVGVQYIMENVSKALLTNIEGTHKIIESCKVNRIPLLLTSTSEVYGVSNDPIWTEESKSLIGPPTKLRWSYAASKLIDEFLALSEHNDGNLNPIIVRLFNIIGPNQLSEFGMVVPKFIEAALKNEPIIIHGEGNQTRSFTWVGDVVNYFYLLAQKGLYGEIFNIGQTEEISIKDLAEMVIKQTNSNSEVIFKTHEEVYGNKFEDPMRRTPSIEKIINATGYEPTMTIQDMIKEIINYKT